MRVTLDFTTKEITVHGRADLKELNELAAKLGEGWAVAETQVPIIWHPPLNPLYPAVPTYPSTADPFNPVYVTTDLSHPSTLTY